MAGHSKWANIKHKKAAADAKKGKVFSKIAKEIMVSARTGGGDPAANITLRALIQKARGVNMPADNIDRAIKKGTGDLDGVSFEEITYEGYAPGGVAVIVQVLTDNKNRSAAEIRHAFTKHNGSLAGAGSVLHAFQRKGLILVKAESIDEEELMEQALEAGAEDFKHEDDLYEITTGPTDFMSVVDALTDQGVSIDNSELTMLPDNYMEITDASQAASLLKFIDALEDLDDVQEVYTNLDVPDEVVATLDA